MNKKKLNISNMNGMTNDPSRTYSLTDMNGIENEKAAFSINNMNGMTDNNNKLYSITDMNGMEKD